MAQREEAAMDQEVFDQTLQAELGKGTDRRVAEGRARAAGVRAYRKVHGEPEREAKPAAERTHAAASGDGGAAPQPATTPAAAAPAAAAPAGAGVAAPGMVYAPPPTAPRTAPPPTGKAPTPKPGAPDKHRLLALVPPEGVQRVEREQGDRINTFPHLMIEEFVSLLVVSAVLVIFSTVVNAPLRELANPNLTPNPSKAPWYFLGLQELLRYFHPMIAGVVIPTLILVGLAAVPYVDRNPSTKPGDRKLAITLFTMMFMFGATLTIAGSFFRGTGFDWTWPWSQGVFFDL
ncbi:MAG: menaquinol-cytochrome c reductase cytochrome b subunit [Actinomycetota bacterium]|nr:menaquinol-cytochrome c reductase cytochrome b subunit [Actinomycetota bacterium]